MLQGFFGRNTGRLYVVGRVRLPAIGVDVRVPFEVDTGADFTVVSLADLLRGGVRPGRLPLVRSASRIRGVAGSLRGYDLPCDLVFDEYSKAYWYGLSVSVPDPRRYGNLPSILGRDVLRRWRTVYDEPRSVLTFTVRSADRTYTRRSSAGRRP